MRKNSRNRKLFFIFSVIAALSMLAMYPAAASAAPPGLAPQNIVYDIFATDGYWTMADGLPIYSYGYIGGREGTAITYLNTKDVNDPDAFNQLLPYTVAAPVAGPNSDSENAIAGNAQFPAPLIYCGVGDTVTIKFKNIGVTNPSAVANDPHSIHLHGLDVDVANDGVPETSIAATAGGGPPELDPLQPGAGNVVVYMFTPKYPGTYFYHCHQEADIHVNMGMMGALVVYNKTDAGRTQGPGHSGNEYGWNYSKDVILLLDDTNVAQHDSEAGSASSLPGQTPNFNGASGPDNPPGTQEPGSYNPVDYHPQYWFINGLSFPMTVHGDAPNLSYDNWKMAHPGYDPLITGSVKAKDNVLLRVINMGFETQPMHMHGFHGKIIGSDQRAWDWTSQGNDKQIGQGLEKNTLTIGSGETYDWLINFGTVSATSTYPIDSQTRYDPASGLPVANTQIDKTVIPAPEIPEPDSAPYIGGPTVHGVGAIVPADDPLGVNHLASQVFVFHNHDDYKATNNGSYPGGMFTCIVPLP